MQETFLFLIEVIGTIAFAISGIRLAAAKNFDWFGAYTVGLVTAIGGGTVRDVLLDIPVFWMQTWWYLAVTGLAFAVIGVQKSLAEGYPMWVAMVMGMITGSFGGVARDILINEEPLFFRKDIYATACLAGGAVYGVIMLCGGSEMLQQIACAVTVIILRVLAVRYSWALPTLSNDTDNDNSNHHKH